MAEKMARKRGERGPDKRPRLTAARVQATQAAQDGIAPLDVMLRTMRSRWDAEDWAGALLAAEKAAPYCHARLATVQQQQLGADGKPTSPGPPIIVFQVTK